MENEDPLYSHLQGLMPDADEDELNTHVNELRARAPGVPDEQLIQAAGGVQQDAARKQTVDSYVANKYGLGDKYSPEARQKLVDQNAADSSGPNWLAGLGALGAGLAGGDAFTAGQQFLKNQKAGRDAKVADFDKGKALAMQDQDYKQSQEKFARESDPSSQESKLAQDIFVKMGGDPTQAGTLTAAKFKDFSGPLKTIYDIKAKEMLANDNKNFQDKMLAQKDQFHKEDLASTQQGKRELKQMELDAAAANKSGGRSEGIKALDKDYAKDYNEWTSSGAPSLSKNLEALKEARNALDKDSSLTGGLTGSLPDRLTADRVLQQRQKVGSAIQSSLKATLGSAFTDKEGERVLKNAYNEAASPAANKASLDALITQLESQKNVNDSKAKYFEQNGTLAGFTPPSTDMVVMQFPDGKTKKVPAGDVAKFAAMGGKAVGAKTAVAGEE